MNSVNCVIYVTFTLQLSSQQLYNCSLFHMKITASVTKSLHQDCGLCYSHLPIFSYTYTLLFCCKIKSCCGCCFPQQIRPQITVQDYSSMRIDTLPFHWYRWGSSASRLQSHYEEAVYFLSLSSLTGYSFSRPQKNERLSQPWSHPVVLNMGPLDSKFSTLTIRPLFQSLLFY